MNTSQIITENDIKELLPKLWSLVCTIMGKTESDPPKVLWTDSKTMSVFTDGIACYVPGTGVILNKDIENTVGMLAHELAHVFTDNESIAQSIEEEVRNSS